MTEKTEWVICWFIEGLGQGYISDTVKSVVPWVPDVSQACRFASEEDADRQIIQWHLLSGFDTESLWPEPLDKVRL